VISRLALALALLPCWLRPCAAQTAPPHSEHPVKQSRRTLSRFGARGILTLLLTGCAPDASNVTPPPDCANGSDTTKVPLDDLGTGCYLQFRGGLYPEGLNALTGAHLAAGLAAAAQIAPLDVNGQPSAAGKYVLVSIGMSNTTQEFCGDSSQSRTCQPPSFIYQAAADPAVNHTTLVLVDGAYGGRSASYWVSAASAEYDRIRDTWLTPLGLSERQVQIAWIKVANPGPRVALPATDADAYALETSIGQIARALRTRYPNLRQLFLSSRIYAGYATTTLNPEPYAYESGFSVKWAIESQISQMAGGGGDTHAGDLRYGTGIAAWLAWGPYPWAAGARARADGLTWLSTDFVGDGTHPAYGGRAKVGGMLLAFFKTSPATSCWFLVGPACH
jgi:hypothetical protein